MRTLKGKVVLVVEDNEAAGEFAASLLEELGYSTRRADCAATAMAVMAQERVDAVFSDIVMPGGTSGLDLAARLRRERPGVAVVLATGYSPRDGAPDAPRDVETLGKPYQLVELAAALERALVRTAAAAN
jgi:DNA-binding NtrC family response regulator